MTHQLNVVAKRGRALAASKRRQASNDNRLGAINQRDDLLMFAAAQMLAHVSARDTLEFAHRAEECGIARPHLDKFDVPY